VKTSTKWVSLGVLVAGLLYGPASLQAQPASEPAPTDRNPIPAADEPAPPSDKPATIGGELGPAGSKPVPIEEDPLVSTDPDKPWSRGVPVENRTAARELFREGNRLFRIPLFSRAAEKYSAALSIWKHPAFYFNLALAQINTGQEVEAKESLERAMAYGAQPLGADRFQEAQRQLKVVMRQLGQIRLVCRTPGAEVTLDGAMVLIGPGSYEGWIKAKSHELTAKKAGYQAEARRVTISSGEILTVDLSLATLSQAADASRRWAAWKPWAIVAAGSAIAAAGGVVHVLSSRNFDAYDEGFLRLSCANPTADEPIPGCQGGQIPGILRDQLIRARQQQTVAVTSYLIGGSLISAGIVLLYLNRPRLAERRVARPSVERMAFTPIISGDAFQILTSVAY
jgi:PEGA domain